MADINVRIAEGCAPEIDLLWDTVWSAEEGRGDWAVAPIGALGNAGGLKATAAIETAVILCLFTDRACPPNHPLAKYADGDLRGYWGDGIDVRADLGEAPLGSLLWLLERSAIDPVETPRWAESFALDALSVLIGQQAVAKVTATATLDRSPNHLNLAVALYGQDGTQLYARRFEDLWTQINRGA